VNFHGLNAGELNLMGNIASLERKRREKRKAARDARRKDRKEVADHTRKMALQFLEDNPSHDWTPEIYNGKDIVRCTVCNRLVTAEDMMGQPIKFPVCPEGGSGAAQEGQ
jgi:hypothetical protein